MSHHWAHSCNRCQANLCFEKQTYLKCSSTHQAPENVHMPLHLVHKTAVQMGFVLSRHDMLKSSCLLSHFDLSTTLEPQAQHHHQPECIHIHAPKLSRQSELGSERGLGRTLATAAGPIGEWDWVLSQFGAPPDPEKWLHSSAIPCQKQGSFVFTF